MLSEIFKFCKLVVFYCPCLANEESYFWLKGALMRCAARVKLYESANLAMLKQFVRPGDTVVDVGANFGVYTGEFSKLVGDSGKVIAFEPLPPVFRVLQRFSAGRTNIKLFNLALSNRSAEKLQIHIPLLMGRLPEPAMASLERPNGEHRVVEVQVNKLDDFLPMLSGVTFMKVDIEGHERAFFEGAESTMAKYRPVFQFEDNAIFGSISFYRTLCAKHDYGIFHLAADGELRPFEEQAGEREYNFYLVPNSWQRRR